MLNLLTFLIGFLGIFIIARYNKSNKLFWLLVISMMSGFIGGTIASNWENSKKSNVEYVSQAMTSCSLPTAQFMLPVSDEEIVPLETTSTVEYTVTPTIALKQPDFIPLYHEGLVPFIFDSS